MSLRTCWCRRPNGMCVGVRCPCVCHDHPASVKPRYAWPVTAMWLRKIDDQVQMLAEIDGQWRLIWSEHQDGPFSAICEARGFERKPLATLGTASCENRRS